MDRSDDEINFLLKYVNNQGTGTNQYFSLLAILKKIIFIELQYIDNDINIVLWWLDLYSWFKAPLVAVLVVLDPMAMIG